MIFDYFSNPNDIILDSFLGSGSTIAVAQKMGRQWIGIEFGEHAYTLCKVRMDNVINGDQTGISKDVNWQGGGGYHFYELAPSLLVKNDNEALARRMSNIKEFTEIKQMEYNAITHHNDPAYASNKKHFKA